MGTELENQQSLPRRNNRGAFQAHSGALERREAAKDAEKIVEL
jgi:hypothetical protein